MSRYDGLIIPRSYSEYINKTDAATLQQALQLPGVLSGAVAAGDNKPVTSNAVNGALGNYVKGKGLKIVRVAKYFINTLGEIEIVLPESFSDNKYSINITYNYTNGDSNSVILKAGGYYQKGNDRFIVLVNSYAEMEVLFTCIGV